MFDKPADKDQNLYDLSSLLSGLELPERISTQNVFHDLMSCIIEQQIHYRSTKKTFEKLLSFTSISELTLENFHEFEKLALPRIKLSEQKYQTVFNVLEFWRSHQIDWQEYSDEQVRSTLSSIKGIGNWTIDMILLFTLNRPDIFPADDYHLKKIMTQAFDLDSSKGLRTKMMEVSDAWKPNRSKMVLHLFEAKKQGLL